MLDLAAKFETDPSKEEDGTWIPLGSDAAIKVARWNNAKFRKRLAQLLKEYELRGGPSDEERERNVVKAMSECVLLDWKGIAIRGEALEYTPENALMVLQDRSLREFANLVTMHANELDNFRRDQIADDAGK